MKSMKIVSALLAGTMLFGLCSCSDSKKNATEEPEETGVEETTAETTEETTEETTAETTTEATTKVAETTVEETSEASEASADESNASAATANDDGYVFISYEGKTAEEMIANIISIRTITPNTTVEDFTDRFDVLPSSTDVDAIYPEDSCIYRWDENNGISFVSAIIVRNEDGSLDTEASYLKIDITCDNVSRCDEVFEASCNAFFSIYGEENVTTYVLDKDWISYSIYEVQRNEKDGSWVVSVNISFAEEA